MARLRFEMQAVRTRSGPLAAGTVFVVYSDAAGTVLADIADSSGGSAIPGSTVTVADVAGLGPSALLFWGPPDGTDLLYLRCPSDASLGVQELEADDSGGGGVSDHGALTGLADNDHPQYATDTDLSTHAGAADPHTGYVLESLVDAKGDLYAASADNTPAKVTVGSTGRILAADSAQTAGLKWIVNEGPLWLTDPRVNAAGGGADDTTPIQAGLTLVDTTVGGSLGIPPGTWKGGNLAYRNQNIVGSGRETSTLKGLPGQDILVSDPTLVPEAEFARNRYVIRDLGFLVDDSSDVSGSLSRGGVGNAALAYPNPTVTSLRLNRIRPSGLLMENVYITSISGTVRGQNACCGFYDQGGLSAGRIGPAVEFRGLEYAWWTSAPVTGLGAYDYFSDHNWINGVHFSGCGTAMRLGNISYSDFATISTHECGDGLIGVGVDSGLGPDEWSNNTFDAIFIEGCTGTPLALPGNGHVVRTMRIQGPHGPVDLACSTSRFEELFVSTVDDAPPVLNVTGHRNQVNLHLNGDTSAVYLRDLVNDTGRGNQVTTSFLWGSNGSFHNQRVNIGRDGRTLHERDAQSILLGHAANPFTSGRDLLVNPLSILPTGLTEDTGFSWLADSTADLGHKLRILGTTCGWFVDHLNALHGFKVGEFLPATKVRVYIKAKVATGGTQDYILYEATGGATDVGSGTLTWTTSYSVQSFDADLSGTTYGDALELVGDALGGGGVGPLDIAWIAFRPSFNDLLVAGRIEEGVQAHGAAGSTETFDLTLGTVHTATLDANLTATFTGATSGRACSMTLILTQDGTGSRTVTWPASVDWPAGTAPTLSTAAGKVDVLTFLTTDGGTTWLGFTGGLDLR